MPTFPNLKIEDDPELTPEEQRRRIIQPPIDKSRNLRKNFENWGPTENPDDLDYRKQMQTGELRFRDGDVKDPNYPWALDPQGDGSFTPYPEDISARTPQQPENLLESQGVNYFDQYDQHAETAPAGSGSAPRTKTLVDDLTGDMMFQGLFERLKQRDAQQKSDEDSRDAITVVSEDDTIRELYARGQKVQNGYSQELGAFIEAEKTQNKEQIAERSKGLTEISKGFTQGTLGATSMLGGALRQYGETSESETLGRIGEFVQYLSELERAKVAPPRVNQFGDVESFNDFMDYFWAKLGEAGGSTTGIIAGGAIGGIPGAGLAAMSMGIGEVRNELEAVGVTDPKMLEKYSYIAGSMVGALDALVPVSIMQKLTGNAKREMAKYMIRRVGAEMAKGATREGITEALQETIIIASTSAAQGEQSFVEIMRNAKDGIVAQRERIGEAAMAGMVGGTGFGTVGGVSQEFTRPRTRDQVVQETKEDLDPFAEFFRMQPIRTTAMEERLGADQQAAAPEEIVQAPTYAESRKQRGADVLQFVRSKGGLKPSGELAGLDADRYPGLINQKGLSADQMREQLVEAGYLEESGPDQPAVTTPEDVFDLVQRAISGERIVPADQQEQDTAAFEAEDQRVYETNLAHDEQIMVLPDIEAADQEYGDTGFRDLYLRMPRDHRAEIIERVRTGEDTLDVIEEMTLRGDNIAEVASMMAKRGLTDEQTARLREIVSEQAPDLIGGLDELLAAMPKRQKREAAARPARQTSQIRNTLPVAYDALPALNMTELKEVARQTGISTAGTKENILNDFKERFKPDGSTRSIFEQSRYGDDYIAPTEFGQASPEQIAQAKAMLRGGRLPVSQPTAAPASQASTAAPTAAAAPAAQTETVSSLMRMKKPDLANLARERGVQVKSRDNKHQIASKIVAAQQQAAAPAPQTIVEPVESLSPEAEIIADNLNALFHRGDRNGDMNAWLAESREIVAELQRLPAREAINVAVDFMGGLPSADRRSRARAAQAVQQRFSSLYDGWARARASAGRSSAFMQEQEPLTDETIVNELDDAIQRATSQVLGQAGKRVQVQIQDRITLTQIAPNILLNAEGVTPITQSEAFKRWFGDSVVVDENGRPLIVYHGTAEDIRIFQGITWASTGIELPADYAAMRNYDRDGGGNILPLYMKIERPFDADMGLPRTVTVRQMVDAMVEQAAGQGRVMPEAEMARINDLVDIIHKARRREESGPHYGRHDFWYEPEMRFGQDGTAAIDEIFSILDFDGIKMIEGGEVTYGAFKPTQIKSAIGNRGTFDPNDPNIVFNFAGKQAAIADTTALDQAQAMIEQGADPVNVWEQTGWFRGFDGEWRFALDSNQYRLKMLQDDPGSETEFGFLFHRFMMEGRGDPERRVAAMEEFFAEGGRTNLSEAELQRMKGLLRNRKNGLRYRTVRAVFGEGTESYYSFNGTLGELLRAPQLFAAYPFMENLPVSIQQAEFGGPSGSASRMGIKVNATDDINALFDTLVHEIQHFIQDYEGFAPGGNEAIYTVRLEAALFEINHQIANARPGSNIVGELEKIRDALTEQKNFIDKGISGFAVTNTERDAYERIAGEAEARLAEKWRTLSPEARRQSYPPEMEDIDRSQQWDPRQVVGLRPKHLDVIRSAVRAGMKDWPDMTVQTLGSMPVTRYLGVSISDIPGHRSNVHVSLEYTETDIIKKIQEYGAEALRSALVPKVMEFREAAEAHLDLRRRAPDSPRNLEGQARGYVRMADATETVIKLLDGIIEQHPEVAAKPGYDAVRLDPEKLIDAYDGKTYTMDDVLRLIERMQGLILRLGEDGKIEADTADWIASDMESHGVAYLQNDVRPFDEQTFQAIRNADPALYEETVLAESYVRYKSIQDAIFGGLGINGEQLSLTPQGLADWQTQLTDFLKSGRRNAWINGEGFRVYVRRAVHPSPHSNVMLNTLDIASVEVEQTGRGAFRRMLEASRDIAIADGLEALYVENVQTERFADFFRRNKWIELPDTGGGPSFMETLSPRRRGFFSVPTMLSIRGFHGSPHDFDRFSMDRIGTGEGAQAFGHGLYFAENEMVAGTYRDNLSAQTMTINGYPFQPRNHAITQIVGRNLSDLKAARQGLAQYAEQGADNPYSDINDAYRIIDAIDDGIFDVGTQGALYEVEIDVEPEQLLDWDLPLSKQSEKVKAALQKAASSQRLDHALATDAETLGDLALRPAFRKEGYGGLDTPSRRIMVKAMRSVLNEPEIRQSVVGLIPVDVVDILAGKKLAPEGSLHDESVFLDLFAVDGSDSVPLRIERSASAIVAIADAAAEHASVQSNIERVSEKLSAALRASEFDHVGELLGHLDNREDVSKLLKSQGISGIRYLDQGSRDTGDGTRNIVIFDDSLVKITKKNGEPVSAEERQGAINQMLSLRGFYSPAIRAAEQLKQERGTGEQFWSMISKAPGVRKDELDWMGLREWLTEPTYEDRVIVAAKTYLADESLSTVAQVEQDYDFADENDYVTVAIEAGFASDQIQLDRFTKNEVLAFMRAHQVVLDEKVLGGEASAQPPAMRELSDISGIESNLPDGISIPTGRAWEASFPEDTYHIVEGVTPDGLGDDFTFFDVYDGDWNLVNSAQSLSQAEHFAAGAYAKRSGADEMSTKFSGYKVPGGTNYREFKILLPGWEYSEPHFGGPVLVHFRADDRIGPNGERIFFINEIQATGHQRGRREGYAKSGQNVVEIATKIYDQSDEGAKLPTDIAARIRDHIETNASDADVIAARPALEAAATTLERGMSRTMVRDNLIQTRLLPMPDAPFKGDLWLELALKRALLYASENGYDAVSWARSDQIAKAVGGDAEALSVQYDQKIGSFLKKYTKKWGGRVEEVRLMERSQDQVRPATPSQELLDRWNTLLAEMEPLQELELRPMARREAGFDDAMTRLEGLRNEQDRLHAEMVAEAQREKHAGAFEVNSFLRITDAMRTSLLEGQPLTIRRDPNERQPIIEGYFDREKLLMVIARNALDPIGTAYHESLHALRTMGLFTPGEWNVLKAAARTQGWLDVPEIRDYQRVYGKPATDENIIEEAIAMAFQRYMRGEQQQPGTIVERLFERIRLFYERIRNALMQRGWAAAEDVFADLASGRIGDRDGPFGALVEEIENVTKPMLETAGRMADSPARVAQPGLDRPGQSLATMVRRFNLGLGLTVRQGRLSSALKRQAAAAGRRLGGHYNTVSGVIRLRVLNELDTLAHEGGHALEGRHKGALDAIKQQHAAELTPLASPGPDALSEGFAEWFRRYVTNPAASTRTALRFEQAFEAFLRQNDPRTMKTLTEIRTGYQQWLAAPSAGVIVSNIVSRAGGQMAKFRRIIEDNQVWNTIDAFVERLYTWTIDDLHPIKQTVEGLLAVARKNLNLPNDARLTIKAVNDPYKLMRLARDGYASGHMDLQHGVRPYHELDPAGPSFHEALVTAFGGESRSQWQSEAKDRFDSYLASRRFVREWDRYFNGELDALPDKVKKSEHLQNIAELERAYPGFQQAAQMLYEFQNNMLAKKLAAGLISQEIYDTLLGRPDYVPVLRDRADLGQVHSGVPARPDKQGILRRFRGSQRDVISPLESIVQDTYDTSMIIARNDAIKALDALATAAGPDGGSFAERIPSHEMQGTRVNVQEALQLAAKEAGVDPADLQIMVQAVDGLIGEDAITTIWRAGEVSEKGEAIVYLWEDGKRVPIRLADQQFGKDMLNAILALGQEITPWYVSMLALPATILRTAITASPDFIFANFIRDQVSAWILADEFTPFVSGIRGIYDDKTASDIGRIYSSVGGIMGGANTATLHNARIKQEVLDLRKRRGIYFRDAPVTNILRITEFTETGTRLGVFRKAYDRAQRDGLSKHEAAIEAAYAARDYIDFGRHGSKMLAMRRIIPFFNAALQGLDRGIRGLRGKVNNDRIIRDAISPYIKSRRGQPLSIAERRQLPLAAKVWAKVAAVGLIGAAIWVLHQDDEEYEEFSSYMRATHWIFKVDGEWYRIPKPFELAFFSNLMERTLEYTLKDDPLAMERFVDGLQHIVLPPTDVPGIKVPIELAFNYDSFTERQIVADHLRALPPHLQFNAYASEFGKMLGRQINVSPAHIDHFITGFGASYGRAFLQGTDALTGNYIDPGTATKDVFDAIIGRRFSLEAPRGAQSVGHFWELIGRNTGKFATAANGYKYYINKARDPLAASEYLKSLDDDQKAYAILHATQTGRRNAKYRDLHPLIRAEEVVSIANELRKTLNLNRLEDEDDERITVRPRERRTAMEILANIQMREARNALIAAQVEGWAQKKPLETQPVLDELEAAVPVIHEMFMERMRKAKLPSYEDVRRDWPEIKRRLLEDGENAELSDLYVPELL
jgi:hypothetical protein